MFDLSMSEIEIVNGGADLQCQQFTHDDGTRTVVCTCSDGSQPTISMDENGSATIGCGR